MIDFDKQTVQAEKNLVSGLKDLFPIQGRKNTIYLHDIKVVTKNGSFDIGAQKDTKLKGKTYSSDIIGSFTLKDEDGKVIDKKTIKMMDMPTVTGRGTFIIKGTEYNVPSQFRIRPGVYSRVQDDGNLTSLVNLAKGRNFKVMLDDEDQKFYILYSGMRIPLYPILTSLGKTKGEVQKVWGQELLDINSIGNHEESIKKLYTKMGGEPTTDLTAMQTAIENKFNETSIEKETTKMTLGKGFDKVDANLLLATSVKLLNIKKGLDKPDERDSLKYKSVEGLSDFMRERVMRQAYKIRRKIMNRIDKHEDIRTIVSTSSFNQPINSFYHDGDVAIAGTPSQANPVAMISETQSVTLTGAGGITNPETVTDEARSVHPSSMGLIDPIFTPESGKIGLSLHFAMGAEKDGNKITAKVVNLKTGKEERIGPAEIERSTVSFSDEFDLKNGKYKPKKKYVRAYSSDGKMRKVLSSKVDYLIRDGKTMFSLSSNLIPFLQNTHPNRGMFGSKMITQSLALTNPEQSLVQTTIGGKSIPGVVGSNYVQNAEADGVVKKIGGNEIVIQHGKEKKSYPFYRDFPLNEGHYFNDTLLVKTGDSVKKGQQLTEGMFTDKGTLAYGKNLKVAYMAPKGLAFEDAIVLSDTAATKMTSKHMYKITIEKDKSTVLGIKKFRLYAPTTVSSANVAKLDEDGVVKEGTVVEPGDIIFAGLKIMIKTPDEEIIGKFSKKVKPYRKYIKEWDKDFFGTVTDVVKSPGGIDIYIKTEEKAQVGDKLAGSYGNKGIISEVLPDHEMPIDKDGNPVEIIMNPLGVPSRVNPGQILETAAGKIASKTGKPYFIENFNSINYLNKIEKDLKAAGLTDKEDLRDPNTNKSLGKIMTGSQYVMKLDHNVAKKLSARGPMGEATYTDDLTPTSGHQQGGQSEDVLSVYSLLSHGAKENLKEMGTDKAQKNDEFWMALESGRPLPNQKPTFAWNKFTNLLKAGGIDIREEGNKVQLLPMTDKKIAEMSNGEIKKEDLIRSKNLVPMKGGLFDKEITGGATGKNWSHITLAEPMLNPVFTAPVRIILNLTGNDIDNIESGKLYINSDGKKVSKGDGDAKTGPDALKRALKSINVHAELAKAKSDIKSAKGNNLDKLNRKIRYLSNLDRLGEDPSVFMTSKVPVLPPIFRPIYPLPDGNLRTSHINIPYKDLITISNQIKEAKRVGMPDEQLQEARSELSDAYKALVGIASPVTRKEFKGVLELVSGSRPKTGYFQSRLMSRRQELTARSTVIPNPNLSMDQVDVPQDILWKIYKPFVKKRLAQQGYSLLRANEQIEAKSESARRALESELKDRPVLMNRAPALHKFSMMAFQPKMSVKKAIGVNPFIVKGFNMDFDGDTVSLHVPVREAARKEAFKMMPSANLYSPRDNTLVHKPSMETIVGLNLLTKITNETNKKYTSEKQALDAYRDKFIKTGDGIFVNGKKTSVGRILLNSRLPEKHQVDFEITKKTMDEYLTNVARESKNKYSDVISILRDVGNDHVYKSGFTIGLDDLMFDTKKKNKIFGDAEKKLTSKSKDEDIISAYFDASKKVDAIVGNLPSDNSFKIMMDSGSRGNVSQVRQVMAAPIVVQDLNENPIPLPITNSYSEGLTTGEYFATQEGARRTMMDRALQTKWPGALNKELVNATARDVVTINDCGTRNGVDIKVGDSNVLSRYVASDPSGTLRYNQLVDTNNRSALILKKVDSIKVRSPLTCESVGGICGKCFGVDENGDLPNIGTNIGVKAAQTIAEPNTQMSVAKGVMTIYRRGGEVFFEEIGDLVDREFSRCGRVDDDGWEVAPGGGIECLALDDDGKLTWREVSVLSRHKSPDYLVKITMKSGRTITATPSHSFVVRKDNEIVKAAAIDLCVGKRLPLLKKTDFGQVVDEIKISDYVCKKTLERGRRLLSIDKIKLDSEFGWFIGAYLSDGNCTENEVAISKVDDAYSQRVTRFYERLGLEARDYKYKKETSIGKYPGRTTKATSYAFSELLRNLCGTGCMDKSVPSVAYVAPDEFIYGFLSGYIDGDGSVSADRNMVRIFSKSEMLMDEVKLLLTRLGIFARKSLEKVVVLTMTSKYAQNILDNGCMVVPKKLDDLKSVAEFHASREYPKEENDGFDGFGNILVDISKKLGLPTRYVNSATKRESIGRDALLGHIKRFEELSKEKSDVDINEEMLMLRNMVDSDVLWDKIKSIEYIDPEDEYVYDFTVPGPQTFATFDGIVTANTMRTFHTGGTSTGEKTMTQGFWRIQDLLHLRSNLPGKAILSMVSGSVKSITPSPSGGYVVYVGSEKHNVPSGREVIVKIGNKIQAGDPITSGPIKPQELAEYKGMDVARDYLVNELDNTYRGNGVKVDRRMFETVVKPMTSTGRVLNPGDSDYVEGDFAPINTMNESNKKLKNKIEFEPRMIGINTIPLHSEDWIARLNSGRIKDTLTEGVSRGFQSEISSMVSPMAVQAYGMEKAASVFDDIYMSADSFGDNDAS